MYYRVIQHSACDVHLNHGYPVKFGTPIGDPGFAVMQYFGESWVLMKSPFDCSDAGEQINVDRSCTTETKGC
jgi:hypothetical protein